MEGQKVKGLVMVKNNQYKGKHTLSLSKGNNPPYNRKWNKSGIKPQESGRSL